MGTLKVYKVTTHTVYGVETVWYGDAGCGGYCSSFSTEVDDYEFIIVAESKGDAEYMAERWLEENLNYEEADIDMDCQEDTEPGFEDIIEDCEGPQVWDVQSI